MRGVIRWWAAAMVSQSGLGVVVLGIVDIPGLAILLVAHNDTNQGHSTLYLHPEISAPAEARFGRFACRIGGISLTAAKLERKQAPFG
jgi:hypothetical protein